MVIDQRIEPFAEREAPRCPGQVEPRLIAMRVIAVCAVSACAESGEDRALSGRSKLAWWRQCLAVPKGIPAPDPFRRGFRRLDPDAFERCFSAGVSALPTPPTPGLPAVVALAGNTLRHAFERGRDLAAGPVVSA